MPLGTYDEARAQAGAIRDSTRARRMPPWLADPNYGVFANNPRLSEDEIRIFDAWASSGAPAGKPNQRAGTAKAKPDIVSVDLLLTAPHSVSIPANSSVNQYIAFPLPFTYDRWIRGADIRPANRSIVDRAVLYVREPGSEWLRNLTSDVPYAVSDAEAAAQERKASDMIASVYTRGSNAVICPNGMGRRVPAGSELVLQIRYTTQNVASEDQPGVGLVLAPDVPAKRVVTLRLEHELRVPSGEAGYKASVSGTLAADALLVSLTPRLEPHGIALELDLVGQNGAAETLLKVDPYRSDLVLNYVLEKPRMLQKGTVLRYIGYFSGPAGSNTASPPGDGKGYATMTGFFDVAVDTGVDKRALLLQQSNNAIQGGK